MTYRNAFSKSLFMIALVGVLMAIFGVWLTTHVRAFNPQPDPPAFGLISLNPGQTLRLNVVNRLVPPPEPDRLARATRHAMLGFDLYMMGPVGSISTAADVPPGPCVTAHHFANRQSCEVTIAPGDAASFDLPISTEGGMNQVLPLVQDDDHNQHPALIYTLEVRENGKTLYTMPAVERSGSQ
jgi:hypothetical protein